MATLQRTIHYKRAIITDSDDEIIKTSLQQYLRLAFNSHDLQPPLDYETPSGSKYSLKATKQMQLFTRNQCMCSWIVKFTPGRYVPITDSNAQGVLNDLVKPVDSKGVERHLQESYMIFAVRGNHVAFITSQGTRLTDLESFFSYFLEYMCKVYTGYTLRLKSVPSPKVIDATEFEDEIQSFKFKEKSFERGYVKKQVDGKKRKVKTLEIKPRGFFEALMSIMPSEQNSIVNDILQSGVDPGQLSLGLTISYTTRNNENGRPLLAALANSFGDINGAMPSLKLKNGKEISGEEILVKGAVSIRSASEDAHRDISFDDALSQVSLWLNESLKDGTIPK